MCIKINEGNKCPLSAIVFTQQPETLLCANTSLIYDDPAITLRKTQQIMATEISYAMILKSNINDSLLF